jgi:hypothetical protein
VQLSVNGEPRNVQISEILDIYHQFRCEKLKDHMQHETSWKCFCVDPTELSVHFQAKIDSTSENKQFVELDKIRALIQPTDHGRVGEI